MKNLQAKHESNERTETPLQQYAKSQDMAKAIEKGYSVINGKIYEPTQNAFESDISILTRGHNRNFSINQFFKEVK